MRLFLDTSVLIAASGSSLDRGDFAELLGHSFYDLTVLKPADFLQRERAAGRLTLEAINPLDQHL